MTNEEQQKIFTRNLNRYLTDSGKLQKDVASAIGVSPQTFNTWCKGIAIPRMGKVQALADYFGIGKTDLIDDKPSHTIPDHALRLFSQLDQIDQERIIERMETMLESDKYQKESLTSAG